MAACRDRHPGVFARFRSRFARPDRVGSRTRHALRSAAGQRRILGLRNNEIAPERLGLSGLFSETGERREFRDAHAGCCWRMNRSLPLPSARTMFGASRTRRRSRTSSGSIRAASSFNCSMGWPGRSSARWWKWVIASANIARSANCFPACPIWFDACSRTHRTKDFCAQNSSENVSAEELLRDPCEIIANRSRNRRSTAINATINMTTIHYQRHQPGDLYENCAA